MSFGYGDDHDVLDCCVDHVHDCFTQSSFFHVRFPPLRRRLALRALSMSLSRLFLPPLELTPLIAESSATVEDGPPAFPASPFAKPSGLLCRILLGGSWPV